MKFRHRSVHTYTAYHTAQNFQNKWTKISGLETNIFELKMMVKSGLEFFVLKFYQPLQSCCYPVQKKLPRKAELAWQVSRYLRRGQQNFKIKNSRPFFTIIFSSKMLVSRSEILVHLFQEFQAVCHTLSLSLSIFIRSFEATFVFNFSFSSRSKSNSFEISACTFLSFIFSPTTSAFSQRK